jgi:pyruvate, orthophosphate dikinase
MSASKSNDSSPKCVYFFGGGKADGNSGMKNELGGKGANLAEMTLLGLPVPPGFTIPTSICLDYLNKGQSLSENLKNECLASMKNAEKILGCEFSNQENPLLVSVRSGARVSMPGMMDTVLNLGLTDLTVEGLSKKTKNPRFAFDSYRRFIQMYANVVCNVNTHLMESAIDKLKSSKKITEDVELEAEDMKFLVKEFKQIFKKETGKEFPQDPFTQLWSAIEAVFKSWNCNRAKKYREINNIPDTWGTAVNVCCMVYGNLGDTSGTGVCFTRDPSTGENIFYGEYLMNAQGEDVVAGIRTPKPLALMKQEMPEVFKQLEVVRKTLEKHYKDVQDIEFTVQDGVLFLLQTRNAKRTIAASLKISLDMVNEGILSKPEALKKINPNDLEKMLHPTLDPRSHKQIVAKGLPASPGACTGRVVFDAAEAESWASRGEMVILVRDETSPEDIGGMHASQGFLTARGGMTSHAAVVARQMGKCCIAGCSSIQINQRNKSLIIGGVEVFEGDWMTLDGSSGEVMLGKVATKRAEISPEFSTIISWADEIKKLKVRANADTPVEAKQARELGAQGIGLCRTEHMFFDENRLPIVREMILAKTHIERERAISKLLPFQRGDFEEILEAMEGFPVTIRLLDPPLHEFLPQTEKDIQMLAKQLGLASDDIKNRVKSLQETNPMLGHRGCRLGISHPEIYEMQVRAIIQATVAKLLQKKNVIPEIMIPLVGHENELIWLRKKLETLARQEFAAEFAKAKAGVPKFEILFGTMIEVPRAALTADKIASNADFFSFGTNDLTQTTFGFSRDDSAPFLKTYKTEGILTEDPFAVLDQDGVGILIKMACKLGRETKPSLKIGICGEHGGEPKSIQFFHACNLDYVSCSTYRVPIAILSAAQANL